MAMEGRRAKSVLGSPLPRKAVSAQPKVAPARGKAKSRPASGRSDAAIAKTNRGPQPIANILAELIARSGIGRVQSTADLQKAWLEAAGPLVARYTRAGTVQRGKLEVIVANSTFMQELNYQKSAIVDALARLLPEQKIKDIRFRLGAIG